jgi:hypothetical protein
LLELVEGTFDDVAALVAALVERRRAATVGAAVLAMPDLVGGLRDDALDPSVAQQRTDGLGRVRLVGSQLIGAGPWSTGPEARDAQMLEQRRERRTVAGLTGRDREDQRQAPSVNEGMDFRR